MKKLEGLQAAPIQDDNLHLGFIKGALDFLDLDVSAAWLAGATGHAFVIEISRGVCPSCVWNTVANDYRDGTMTRLGRNLGYELEYRHANGGDEGLGERREAWDAIQRAVDSGHPCYMYHNFCYQMIDGCDADGVYFAPGCPNAGQGPVSVVDRGEFDMGIVAPATSKADNAAVVKDGLAFALAHPQDRPAERGLSAYDRWIETIESGESGGTWRSIRAWHTCRSLGVEFLAEAKQRLGGVAADLFDEAAAHYQVVAQSLEPIAARCAAGDLDLADQAIQGETVEQLRSARDAEAKGIAALEKIVAAL